MNTPVTDAQVNCIHPELKKKIGQLIVEHGSLRYPDLILMVQNRFQILLDQAQIFNLYSWFKHGTALPTNEQLPNITDKS